MNYKAKKLYGPMAEKKANWAIQKGWLYTTDGLVFRRTSNGDLIQLLPFAMNGRPHIKTFFFEYELLLPVDRLIELEAEWRSESDGLEEHQDDKSKADHAGQDSKEDRPNDIAPDYLAARWGKDLLDHPLLPRKRPPAH